MKKSVFILLLIISTSSLFAQEYVQTTTNSSYANKSFSTTGNLSLGLNETTLPNGGTANLQMKTNWGNWMTLIDGQTNDWYVFHNPNGGGRMELINVDGATGSKKFGVFTVLNNGNIGMGTTSPQAKLEVKRSGTIGGTWNPSASFLTIADTGSSKMIMDSNEIYGSNTLHIGSNSGDIVKFRSLAGGASDKMVIKANGYVGIGTTNPLAKLHVNNGNNSYGTILANATEANFSLYTKTLVTSPINVESFRLGLKYGTNENNGFISFYRGSSASGGYLGLSTNGAERIRIAANGQVGIGTTSPDSKLTVKGKIHAEEVKIDLSVPAPDYVFLKDYNLKTIDEVEAYIQQEGHLPNIPSARVMETEGVELGLMNMKLLEKIEELTLYTIAQEKKLKELDAVKAKNKQLEERLAKIEGLLSQNK